MGFSESADATEGDWTLPFSYLYLRSIGHTDKTTYLYHTENFKLISRMPQYYRQYIYFLLSLYSIATNEFGFSSNTRAAKDMVLRFEQFWKREVCGSWGRKTFDLGEDCNVCSGQWRIGMSEQEDGLYMDLSVALNTLVTPDVVGW